MQQVLANPSIIGMLGAPFLSMLVGWLTHSSTPARFKSILLVILSIAYAIVEELATEGSQFNIWVALVKAFAAFFAAVSLHIGMSKPTGLADLLQEIGPALGANPDPGAHEAPPTPPAQ